MFDGTNKNCKESILELQFTNSTADGTFHKHVLHFWVAPGSMSGWDEIRVSDMMYNEFLKEGRIAEGNMYDARAYGSMMFDDPYYYEGGHILGTITMTSMMRILPPDIITVNTCLQLGATMHKTT